MHFNPIPYEFGILRNSTLVILFLISVSVHFTQSQVLMEWKSSDLLTLPHPAERHLGSFSNVCLSNASCRFLPCLIQICRGDGIFLCLINPMASQFLMRSWSFSVSATFDLVVISVNSLVVLC